MIRSLALAAVAAVALCSAARADPPTTRPRVANLAWMSGTWRHHETKDRVTEEIWSEPIAGTMIGMFRETAPAGKSTFEFLVIEDDEKGATKRFKHFRSGFIDMEKEPLTLEVGEVTKNKVVFQATVDGKLKSIVYERDGDKLHVKVNTTRQGKPFVIPITMERVAAK
jgi:hypothetical protein